MNPAKDPLQADHEALNDFIVNCPELEDLESLLGGFNLFQVLKFEHGEIRHSNVLGWILDPSESHGLSATFLQKWLKRVIHEAPDSKPPVGPVDIDTWQLLDVEVRREWRNIDLLLILHFSGGPSWIVCIENKIDSRQHSDQLRRYRKTVENDFPNDKKIYFFLTKNPEPPEDDAYIPASYTQVHQTLRECLAAKSHQIGSEPKVLLENYIRLIEEKFMDESEIARIARLIYKQHRRALDVIFDHRPDNLQSVSVDLQSLFQENAKSLGIIMGPCDKSFVRFVPKEWDHSGNCRGSAWQQSNRTILFEIFLRSKTPKFSIAVGGAPDAWIDELWERSKSFPFKRKGKRRNPVWNHVHIFEIDDTPLGEDASDNPDEVARKIYDSCVLAMQQKQTRDVVAEIAGRLPALDHLMKSV